MQGRNHEENLDATYAMVGRICPPPGGDRVKVSQNLGATQVAPVHPWRDLALTIDIPKKIFSRSFTKIDLVGVWLNISSSVSCKGQN